MHALRFIAVACVLAGCASTQPVQQADETIEVTLEAPGAPKERIFDVIRSSITDKLRAAQGVIDSENRQQGTLVAHATIPFPCSGDDCRSKHGWELPFTMRVDIQDARFKVAFTKIRLTWPEYSYRPAYDGPVRPYGDWESVKARLTGLAGELQRAVMGTPAFLRLGRMDEWTTSRGVLRSSRSRTAEEPPAEPTGRQRSSSRLRRRPSWRISPEKPRSPLRRRRMPRQPMQGSSASSPPVLTWYCDARCG